ncbi:MnhB domain-containing protein [Halovivax gelatinilyticus]|uniref:MnhB domain-containing protein n=1 Tax=Halovivax gelatinilyticus TaxID=2961597 RepID=UPI0020CA950C|nr:MnhB domain-containing protein [Halovivax gelatinilyticus]
MADPVDDTYTESQVIMTAVKIIAPFTLTYGLFMTFHGADTPGGSFQGGAIIGVTILMLAFAFGIEPTRQWLKNSVLVGLVAGGVAVFVGVGLAAIALGGNFLQYDRFETVLGIPDGTKWGMEAIEIGGIALIVAGVVVTLFFATAAGFPPKLREHNGHSRRNGPSDGSGGVATDAGPDSVDGGDD